MRLIGVKEQQILCFRNPIGEEEEGSIYTSLSESHVVKKSSKNKKAQHPDGNAGLVISLSVQ